MKLAKEIIWLLLIIYIHFIFSTKVDLKGYMKRRGLLDGLDSSEYEIVYPFQIRDKNDRIGIETRNHFLNGTVHYSQTTFVIRGNNIINRLRLTLELNQNIFYNETIFNKLDDNGEAPLEEFIENCYYQGTIQGITNSFVALSTCDGLHGIISYANGTAYQIIPLEGGEHSRRHPHLLYKAKWNQEAVCGAITLSPSTHSLPTFFNKRKRRDISKQTKYIEIAVISDYFLYKKLNKSTIESIKYTLNLINTVDLILSKQLNIRLAIVYGEWWSDEERVDMNEDIERSLTNVLEYTTGHIYNVLKDNTIFITGFTFSHNEQGTATFSSICTARGLSLIKAMEHQSVFMSASLLVQSLAHNFGIDHDSMDCLCENNQRCVMNKQIGSIGTSFTYLFSKCSQARLHSALRSGELQCLLNKPFHVSELYNCGNGIVDENEECDCGTQNQESCTDPCCDANTCRLRSFAQCASHQECCHRCEIKKAGQICRPSRSSCDVPEICDGESGDCPIDGYMIDGTACGINGNCWKGNCSDIDQECKKIWGHEASAAELACFEQNERGVEYANCGLNKDNTFQKCDFENVRCGSLQCKDGTGNPIDDSLNSFNFNFVTEGKRVTCKAITNPFLGRVPNGASCGPSKICIDGTCLPLAKVSPPVYCPSNNLAFSCSGHGDCITSQKCLCYDGWAGVACDIKSNSSRRIHYGTNNNIFSKTIKNGLDNNRTVETTTLLIILFIVAVFLFLILICLVFCYRRKSTPETVAHNIVFDKADESFGENINRSIKFGNMPSYREEKRRRKKNKKVYDALHRISEATDERDSTSLKSRESEPLSLQNDSIYGINRQNSSNYIPFDENRLRKDLSSSQRSLMRNVEPSFTIHPHNIFDDTHIGMNDKIYSQSVVSIGPFERIVKNSPSKSDYGGYTSRIKRDYQRKEYRISEDGDEFSEEMSLYSNSRYSIQQPSLSYLPQTFKTQPSMSPSTSSYAGSSSKLTPTPLKLNNIGILLKQLQQDYPSTNQSPTIEYKPTETEESELSNGEQHIDRNSQADSVPNIDLEGYTSATTYICGIHSSAGNLNEDEIIPRM
uniref:Disintegrin and metalloproteinase domain-containing protein 2 n=2 Tax=Strongyloides stercoralis TaxID=6248 RepID=A0A0K0DZ19_STRER